MLTNRSIGKSDSKKWVFLQTRYSRRDMFVEWRAIKCLDGAFQWQGRQ